MTDDIYTHHTHNTIVMALWSPKCLGANKGISPTVDGHTVLGFQYLRTTQIKPPSCLSFPCPNGHRAGQKPSHRGCHLPSYSQEHLAVPKRNRSMGNLTCMFKTVFILLLQWPLTAQPTALQAICFKGRTTYCQESWLPLGFSTPQPALPGLHPSFPH